MCIHVHVFFIWVLLLAIFRVGRLGASRITDPPLDRPTVSLPASTRPAVRARRAGDDGGGGLSARLRREARPEARPHGAGRRREGGSHVARDRGTVTVTRERSRAERAR